MSPFRRVAVLSRRQAENKVWHASQFEFEDVIASIDDAFIVAPIGRGLGPQAELAHQALNRVGKLAGRPRRAPMLPVGDAVDCELFFGVFAAPTELNMLPFVREQLTRAKRKVAFIVEMYAPDAGPASDYLRQLRGFDHIYVFTRDVIPAIQRITGVPTSFLETGVDAERFVPVVPGPARTIDVTSYGRRLGATHKALLSASADRDFHYSYDTVSGPFEVTDYRDHRRALAATLQRSRYAVVYKNNDTPGRINKTAGEETLTNRYYEVTAAGAVMLGSAPDGEDFRRNFGWEDSLVPIPAPAPDVVDVIASLDGDPLRTERARRAGMLAGLRRHDWLYRWQQVLADVGLPEDPRVAERLALLEGRARDHEAVPVNTLDGGQQTRVPNDNPN